MELLRGIGVSPGVAVGPAYRKPDPTPEPSSDVRVDDALAEASRIAPAAMAVAAELEILAQASTGDLAEILDATALMAADPTVVEAAVQAVRSQSLSAERGVWFAFGRYRSSLAEAGGYLAERVADLDDVRDRIIARLRGEPAPGMPNPGHPFVLIARDLSPADTALLDVEQVLGFVTESGGPTSHTAILAKSLGLPGVVACRGVTGVEDGATVVVDGTAGRLAVTPDDSVLRAARDRVAAQRRDLRLTEDSGRTADGVTVLLLANIGDAAGAEAAVRAGAQGIGLFRTEFLFLDRTTPPSQEEQLDRYAEVFDRFPGRKVVIRTLDAGADKPLPFLHAEDEPNPALGVRGFRLRALRADVLEEQLAAIARAARDTRADVHVMAPMISTADEAADFVALARSAGLDQAGIMIEVPAAALTAEHIVRRVDFISIGTNDLTQYTYAADRMHGGVAELNDHWQPAVSRLIEMVGRAGAEAGTPIGVCGEAAADPAFAAVLVGLGVRSLSMAPNILATVDAALAAVSLEECRRMAKAVLAAPSATAAREQSRNETIAFDQSLLGR